MTRLFADARAVLLVVSASLACATGAAAAAKLDAALLRQPRYAALALSDGRQLVRNIGPDGAVPGALSGRRAGLAVEQQRRAYDVIAAGVAAAEPERSRLVDAGLRALEWGFRHAGPDGSFPEERGGSAKREYAIFPKTMFLAATARSLLLLDDAPVNPALKARARALVGPLQKSVRWAAGSSDLRAFYGWARTANQLLFAPVAMADTAALTGDPALKRRAQELVQQVLARQLPDGTFPEKDGFDSTYQSLSLEILAHYADSLEPSPWRQRVTAALRLGTARLMKAIDTEGTVQTAGNTRTMACGRPIAGPQPKDHRANVVPRRLYSVSAVLGDPRLVDVAERVQRTGQRFDHIEQCDPGRGRPARNERPRKGRKQPAL